MNTTANAGPFEAMTNNDEWLGFGYIGARRNALDTSDPGTEDLAETVAATDELVLAYAAEQGWSAEDLFEWANSKNGRWFADTVLHGRGPLKARFAEALRHGLLSPR